MTTLVDVEVIKNDLDRLFNEGDQKLYPTLKNDVNELLTEYFKINNESIGYLQGFHLVAKYIFLNDRFNHKTQTIQVIEKLSFLINEQDGSVDKNKLYRFYDDVYHGLETSLAQYIKQNENRKIIFESLLFSWIFTLFTDIGPENNSEKDRLDFFLSQLEKTEKGDDCNRFLVSFFSKFIINNKKQIKSYLKLKLNCDEVDANYTLTQIEIKKEEIKDILNRIRQERLEAKKTIIVKNSTFLIFILIILQLFLHLEKGILNYQTMYVIFITCLVLFFVLLAYIFIYSYLLKTRI